MAKKTLLDVVRQIRPAEDAFLIVWDRQTGKFKVSYEGQGNVHSSSLASLLANVSQQVQQQIDTAGFWQPETQEEQPKEETAEWTPPWMKN